MLYQNVLVSLRALTCKPILSCDGSCHRSAVLFDGGLITGGYASTGSTPGYVPSLLWSFL